MAGIRATRADYERPTHATGLALRTARAVLDSLGVAAQSDWVPIRALSNAYAMTSKGLCF